jgi:hypothetical protein
MPRPAPPVGDLSAAIHQALAQPVAGSPLRDMARRGQRARIVFTDATPPVRTTPGSRLCRGNSSPPQRVAAHVTPDSVVLAFSQRTA